MSTVLGLPRVRVGAAGTRASPGRRTAGRPDVPGLVDTLGRTATDLRVSLTDRCTLRCSYCMPPEGLDWMPAAQVLTDAEVVRLMTIAVERLGVTQVRFTGGEPLLRRGLEQILAACAELRCADGSRPRTSLTTNGLGLARRAEGLAVAGLDRVNVSLDTLRADTFATLTHRDRHADVLAGLAAARAAGLGPVKVNAVLMRGVNDDEAGDLLRWAVREGYELRFIEQMPLEPHGAWDRSSMVDAADILAALSRVAELRPERDDDRGAAPAERWHVRLPDGDVVRTGTVGVIASVTRPFCAACARTRLTADGQVRDCLFATGETDLRSLLRGGADDGEVADVWRTAMWGKRAAHGLDAVGTASTGGPTAEGTPMAVPSRPMSAIGG